MIRFVKLHSRWYKVNEPLTFDKGTIFDGSPSSRLSFVCRKNSYAKRVHFCKNCFFDVVCACFRSGISVLGSLIVVADTKFSKLDGRSRKENRRDIIYANLSSFCSKIV